MKPNQIFDCLITSLGIPAAVACCGDDRFDRDELGVDPEEDSELDDLEEELEEEELLDEEE